MKPGCAGHSAVLMRWHSSSRIVSRAPSPSAHDGDDHDGGIAGEARARGASFHGADEVPKGLHPVYVGKSCHRYLIAEELVGHLLFQTLIDRTGGGAGAPAERRAPSSAAKSCCSSTCG